MIADRRRFFRASLSDIYLPIYDAVCEGLDERWQPYQGTRTFVQQDALWMQGRTLPGSIVTNAKGGESAHNYGCGSDWTIFDGSAPQWLNKTDARWEEYKSAVQKAGARWGGEFGDVDHNELKISVNWPRVAEVYKIQGMDGAMGYIKTVLEG